MYSYSCPRRQDCVCRLQIRKLRLRNLPKGLSASGLRPLSMMTRMPPNASWGVGTNPERDGRNRWEATNQMSTFSRSPGSCREENRFKGVGMGRKSAGRLQHRPKQSWGPGLRQEQSNGEESKRFSRGRINTSWSAGVRVRAPGWGPAQVAGWGEGRILVLDSNLTGPSLRVQMPGRHYATWVWSQERDLGWRWSEVASVCGCHVKPQERGGGPEKARTTEEKPNYLVALPPGSHYHEEGQTRERGGITSDSFCTCNDTLLSHHLCAPRREEKWYGTISFLLNIPGREEKVPFSGSGYNPQKALDKPHQPNQPRKGSCKPAKKGIKMSPPQTEWLLGAGVTHIQQPLRPPRAASRESSCSFREKKKWENHKSDSRQQ